MENNYQDFLKNMSDEHKKLFGNLKSLQEDCNRFISKGLPVPDYVFLYRNV